MVGEFNKNVFHPSIHKYAGKEVFLNHFRIKFLMTQLLYILKGRPVHPLQMAFSVNLGTFELFYPF